MELKLLGVFVALCYCSSRAIARPQDLYDEAEDINEEMEASAERVEAAASREVIFFMKIVNMYIFIMDCYKGKPLQAT